MKNMLSLLLVVTLYGCSSTDSVNTVSNQQDLEDQWVVPEGTPTGSFNLFPLAQNPTFSEISEVSFISDNELVAVISFNNEIRVYPYQYLQPYESVNDVIDNKTIAMTYCPITKSALCWDTSFKEEKFILRASGYLLNDNVILYDEQSNTYWSQMLVSCIKGKYAGESNFTFNFIETTWGTAKNYFTDAKVFTNTSVNRSSINKKTANNDDIVDGESVYGIIDKRAGKNSKIHIFKYDDFENETKIYQTRVNSKRVIVIGSKKDHFITSYINENNNSFTPIQDNFPVIMVDEEGNKWDVFGVAVEGSKKGQQLDSPIGFVALGWAWEAFYDDFIFIE